MPQYVAKSYSKLAFKFQDRNPVGGGGEGRTLVSLHMSTNIEIISYLKIINIFYRQFVYTLLYALHRFAEEGCLRLRSQGERTLTVQHSQ